MAAPNLPESEITSLHSLYNSTAGWNWAWTEHSVRWNFAGTPNPCAQNWYGVTCGSPDSNGYRHVLNLVLLHWNLRGTLPKELNKLTELEELNLSYNLINGTIPAEFGAFAHLTTLYLFVNDLTGTIPLELSNITSLQYLTLSDNPLTGTLPSQLGQLLNLTLLSIFETDTSGPLPSELGNCLRMSTLLVYESGLTGTLPSSLGNLLLLEAMYLEENHFTSTIPSEFGNLQQLTQLFLYINRLTGSLPAELGNMLAMEQLVIFQNEFTGPFPTFVCNFTHMNQLYLYQNEITGTLPPQLSNVPLLQQLDLSENLFTGSIPPEWRTLHLMNSIDLDINLLTGVIPPELGELVKLTELILDTNFLNGTVPVQLSNLALLEQLWLHVNDLTGTIPSELSGLSQLTVLFVSQNELTGTIPPELSMLTKLQYLWVDTNKLTGTVPPALGNLTHLLQLFIGDNQLSGNLPGEIGNLVLMLSFDLGDNFLSGTLPSELGNLTEMWSFLLQNNSFSGTLPIVLCNLPLLEGLYISYNMFSGTLPPEVGNLARSQGFELESNRFTGSLPAELGRLQQLSWLYLYDNDLTGTLPPQLGNLTRLVALAVEDNTLTGQVPSTLLELPVLQYLSVANNLISGTLPAQLSTAPALVYLSASYNHLWGCLPAVGGIPSLQEIDVTHNQLRCSLDGVFTPPENSPRALLNVQISHNQFTGPLPEELFQWPLLQTLVAVSNCFTGTLTEQICSATRLKSLILDGLGASHSCPTVWTTWQREGRLRLVNRVHGTLPECVLEMPHLSSLHLSGNNLIGSVADNVALMGNLTQLYLSHNRFTGSVPEVIQNQPWYQLDLSYNRFGGSLLPSFGSGTLDSELFAVTESIVINNSRLSGEIPATVLQLPQVSMLGTNIFSCKADKSDVPNSDGNGDKQRYQCGSDSFNYAYYLFLGLVGIAAAALLVVFRHAVAGNTALAYVNKWQLPFSRLSPSCQGVLAMISVLTQVAVYCSVPLLLVLVPWYSAASHYYGTYTHQYAWVVSAAFLSGLAPGLVEFFLWTGLIALVTWLAYYFSSRSEEVALTASAAVSDSSGERNKVTDETISISVRVQAYIIFLVVNLTVVVGVNVAFVYVSLNERSEAVLLAQVVLSLFKFAWNTVCVPLLLEWISKHLMPVRGSSGFFRVQTFIGLFNNIAIPCLVVAAESPSCFRDLLFPPDDVTSIFAVQNCQLVNTGEQSVAVDCSDPLLYPQQSSFAPQFSYSYECSSSFVTYYSAAMVYLALTAAVLVPAVRLLLCWVVNNTAVESRIHKWSNAALPRLWRVPAHASNEALRDNRTITFMTADNLLVNMTVYLGILLSFGVVFPPVALAMCVAMLSTAYQTRLVVGRLLCNAREVGAQNVVDAVEQDCKGVASLVKLQSMIFMAIVFACCFYALFIFDTIGDVEGFAAACWVLILMPLVAWCVHTCARTTEGTGLSSGGLADVHSISTGNLRSTVVEMREVSSYGTTVGKGTELGGPSAVVAPTISALHASESV